MFDNKKIFVLGMAKSGYEVAKLLASKSSILITDKKEQDEGKVKELNDLGVNVIITDNQEELLDNTYDYVVKNPAVSLDNPVIEKARNLKIPIINEMEVAYKLLPKNVVIIGVTGSNGKTTTTKLIYEFLKAHNLPVHIGGNIGIPLCALLNNVKEKEILVLEISSHQLVDFKDFKVDIAVFTNISEVHLDHFKDYDNYKKVKMKIFNNQTENDIAVLNKDDKELFRLTKNIKANKIYFSKEEADIYLKNNYIYNKQEPVLEISDIRLKGMHNVENVMCAVATSKILGVTNEEIKQVLNNFAGVEHRIEFVRRINNRDFYNDSKSTNIKSTEVALNSFNNNVILILGGLDRKQSFEDLKNNLDNIKNIVCYGEVREKIEKFANKYNIPVEKVDNLEEAVRVAYDFSEEFDTILLSPGSASWDQYESYVERGNEFKKVVNNLER